MFLNDFFLYVVIPVFTLFLIFTNRYYYTKKQSQKMRFNMREDLFFGNIVGPIVGLVIILAIYANIIKINTIEELRWEILAIFTIVLLILMLGIGLGAHIVAVSVEKSIGKHLFEKETDRILYFFHWPFGHIMTFVPASLVCYVLVLLDLIKGEPEKLAQHQELILITFGLFLSTAASISFIITHVTRIMFYTMGILSLSILFVLSFEAITLNEHLIAYFFTVIFISSFFMMITYRYTHLVSKSLHTRIHAWFPDGDKVIDEKI